ncbi:hypothetical protein PRIPAC_75572 [Pristionchus pacificus]|uniref:Uncharacterized protein n=1 Tax=Pristionchus pacificus TaxID=54126 RepID=A0A2A6B5H6_PRIPA|nr:hypothetical protein PRIPAC_75572 [Pristionchus pacificus]|eukprot:PDM61113.1 hypothetical protein PRIPAC_54919 [Pristionchus pacificus]
MGWGHSRDSQARFAPWPHPFFFGSPEAPRAFRQRLAGSLRSQERVSPGRDSLLRVLRVAGQSWHRPSRKARVAEGEPK